MIRPLALPHDRHDSDLFEFRHVWSKYSQHVLESHIEESKSKSADSQSGRSCKPNMSEELLFVAIGICSLLRSKSKLSAAPVPLATLFSLIVWLRVSIAMGWSLDSLHPCSVLGDTWCESDTSFFPTPMSIWPMRLCLDSM